MLNSHLEGYKTRRFINDWLGKSLYFCRAYLFKTRSGRDICLQENKSHAGAHIRQGELCFAVKQKLREHILAKDSVVCFFSSKKAPLG